jgi:hypothetical protein
MKARFVYFDLEFSGTDLEEIVQVIARIAIRQGLIMSWTSKYALYDIKGIGYCECLIIGIIQNLVHVNVS